MKTSSGSYRGGRRPYRQEWDMELSEELLIDPFSEEELPSARQEHTKAHRRYASGSQKSAPKRGNSSES